MLYEIIVSVCICVIVLMIKTNINYSGLPPSPWKICCIGNLHEVFRKKMPLHKLFASFNYPITTFWFGSLPLIIVNDYELAKKVCLSATFSGRPQRYAGDVISRGFKGVIITDYSAELRDRRRISTKSFQWHDTSKLDGLLRTQTDSLIRLIKAKLKNSPSNVVEIYDDIKLCTCNIMWQLLFNKTIDECDIQLSEIIELMNWMNIGLTCGNILEAFPLLKKFNLKNLNYLHKFAEKRDSILKKEFDSHLANFDETNIQDFTDLLIYEQTDREVAEMIASDMIVAGFETTSNALNFTMIYLLNNVSVKRKCIEEIHKILGEDGEMKLELVDQFHYITAVISETLRIRPIGMLGAPHRACKTAKLANYTIPKHVGIILNIYNINHDSRYHEKPELFNPNRFLDDRGFFKTIESFIPFGTGRRECLGKRFAMKEMVYFMVVLLKEISFQLPNCELISDDPIANVMLTPRPYSVKIDSKV